uniref:Uncharacterized protein n=1 Tax=Ananas comosus var. bracteatus TaxID=296719 RepID=A0A6V7Q1K2_ANACO|nr:unnamed protein product [Ananas comosus var. bracteatus]
MAITVDIVSRETVKPSTPTPPQLRGRVLRSPRANADLSEILSSDEPDLGEVKKFLPCSKARPLAVTLSRQSFSQCKPPYSDAAALLSASASRTRSQTADRSFRFCKGGLRRREVLSHLSISPSFDGAAVFPPKENAVPNAAEQPPEKPPQVHKRFVLGGPKIAALREKTASSAATRFQAVAALVWRCAVRARPSPA